MQLVQTQIRRATDLLVAAIRDPHGQGDVQLRTHVRRALELVVEATLRQASGSTVPLPPPPLVQHPAEGEDAEAKVAEGEDAEAKVVEAKEAEETE